MRNKRVCSTPKSYVPITMAGLQYTSIIISTIGNIIISPTVYTVEYLLERS